MNSDIMVSVCCLVYNHEKYLRKCLDGFVMQKTNFKFEVLIHDDASTDKSAEIIREYEEKYPDIIKPIYQTENQYSQKIPVAITFQYPRAKGKYIAICEGDDYWTNPNKLQMQYDALEANDNCKICVHKVRSVNEAGEIQPLVYPDESNGFTTGVLNPADALNFCKYYFQTSSYFFEKDIYFEIRDSVKAFLSLCPTGDEALRSIMALVGDYYYIDEEMSCYREGAVGSWTSTVKHDNAKKINRFNRYQSYIEHYIEYLKVNNYDKKMITKASDNLQEVKLLCYFLNKDIKNVFKINNLIQYKKRKMFTNKELLYLLKECLFK